MLELVMQKPINNGPYRGKLPTDLLKECFECGDIIVKKAHSGWAAYRRQKFCSVRCEWIHRTGSNSNFWKPRKVLHCKQCRSVLSNYDLKTPPSARRRKYCSRRCEALKRYGKLRPMNSYKVVAYVNRKPVFEHVQIATRALGRPLRKGEVVHHINGKRNDNRPKNLLICSASYHNWLHQRMSTLYMQEHFD